MATLWTSAIITDPELQALVDVIQFDIYGSAGSMPACIRQSFLDDAEGSKFNTGVQGSDLPANDQASARPRRIPGVVDKLNQFFQPGLGPPNGLVFGILSQHAQKPAHLRQRASRCISDRHEMFGTLFGQTARSQPRRLRLNSNHGDVMGDDIMKFSSDARPLAAGSILEKSLGKRLACGRVCYRPASSTMSIAEGESSKRKNKYR